MSADEHVSQVSERLDRLSGEGSLNYQKVVTCLCWEVQLVSEVIYAVLASALWRAKHERT